MMILLTTTSPDVDEELLNRCLALSVDERRGQTRKRSTSDSAPLRRWRMLLREDRQQVRRLHKNAWRLLEPVMVVNPYAQQLEFVDHATRARRDQRST
ncbi:MAG: hypothetical protein IPG04_40060 [Polyangiaceae bacterium]|nr:hypothetical protein [Polyangiaceae bacterium]